MGRKRKIELNTYTNESSNSSQSHLNIVQRSAANDRERTRMRVLSKAFVKLKTSLPWVPSDTKLSKLDTLKLATSYISYLTKILEDDELAQNLNTQQGSLTTQISNNEDDKKNNEYQGNNVYPSFSGTSASNGFCWPFSSNNQSNNAGSYGDCSNLSESGMNQNRDNDYKMFMIDQNT